MSNTKLENPEKTQRGTLCAPSWDAAWIDRINTIESRFHRRICGARPTTPGAEPCNLAPNHDNGRCRFHGGFPNTGGQDGNSNALIHGLYARRLQVCGTQCPAWQTCPLAGPDIIKQDANQRPQCPYEQQEYEACLKEFPAASGTRGAVLVSAGSGRTDVSH